MADNPIGKLNEYSAKHLSCAKIIDEYVDAGSPQQGPKFICNMTLGSYKGRGEGRSKKSAKTEAAQNILTQILSSSKGATTVEDSIDGVNSSPSPSTTNAKGSLQELCQKNALSIPEYKVMGKTGQDHQLQFTVLCTVKDSNKDILKQIYGNAIGKKQAEIDAATKMKQAIEDLLSNINNTGATPFTPRSGQSKDSTPASAMELDSEAISIDELMIIIISKNFETPELLIQTSEPVNSGDLSTMKYLCIAQAYHSSPRSVACLYELSSYPIAAQGIGSTEDEAKREALLNLNNNIGTLLDIKTPFAL